MIRGYVDAALDADAFDSQGYFRTGDLGVVEPSGHVRITGRSKDVIIRNAENISAQEIENVLYTHPDIADVAVIGLPDAADRRTLLRGHRPRRRGFGADVGRPRTTLRGERPRQTEGPGADRVRRCAAAQRDGKDPQARTSARATAARV